MAKYSYTTTPTVPTSETIYTTDAETSLWSSTYQPIPNTEKTPVPRSDRPAQKGKKQTSRTSKLRRQG